MNIPKYSYKRSYASEPKAIPAPRPKQNSLTKKIVNIQYHQSYGSPQSLKTPTQKKYNNQAVLRNLYTQFNKPQQQVNKLSSAQKRLSISSNLLQNNELILIQIQETISYSYNITNSSVIISSTKLNKLKINENDYIIIQGNNKKSTVAVVSISNVLKQQVISMSQVMRRNIKAQIGQKVKIKPLPQILNLTKVCVLPYQDTLFGVIGDLAKNYLIPYFKDSYRPIKKGDSFIIQGSQLKSVEFKVILTQPVQYGIVVSNTLLLYEGVPIDRKQQQFQIIKNNLLTQNLFSTQKVRQTKRIKTQPSQDNKISLLIPQNSIIEILNDVLSQTKSIKKKLTPYIKKYIQNQQLQTIFQILNYLKNYLTKPKCKLMYKFNSLYCIKVLFDTFDFILLNWIEASFLPVIIQIAQHALDKSNQGKQYFLNFGYSSKDQRQIQKLGYSYTLLALEMIQVGAKVKPNQLFQDQFLTSKSDFAIALENLKKKGFTVQGSMYFYKPQAVQAQVEKYKIQLSKLSQQYIQKYQQFSQIKLEQYLNQEHNEDQYKYQISIVQIYTSGDLFLSTNAIETCKNQIINLKSLLGLKNALNIFHSLMMVADYQAFFFLNYDCALNQLIKQIVNCDKTDKSLNRGLKFLCKFKNPSQSKEIYLHFLDCLQKWSLWGNNMLNNSKNIIGKIVNELKYLIQFNQTKNLNTEDKLFQYFEQINQSRNRQLMLQERTIVNSSQQIFPFLQKSIKQLQMKQNNNSVSQNYIFLSQFISQQLTKGTSNNVKDSSYNKNNKDNKNNKVNKNSNNNNDNNRDNKNNKNSKDHKDKSILIKQLFEQNAQKDQKIQALNQQIYDLQNKFHKSTEQNQKLKQQTKKLKQQTKKLKQQTKKQQSKKLKQQDRKTIIIDQKNKQIQQKNKQIQQKNQQIEQKNNFLEQLNIQIKKIRQQKQNLLKQLEKKIKIIEINEKTYQQQIIKQKQSIKLHNQIKQLNQIIEAIKKQLYDTTQKKKILYNKLLIQIQKNSKLLEKQQKKEQFLKNKQQKLKKVNQKLFNLQNQIQKQNERIITLRNRLVQKQDDLNNLNNILNAKDKKILQQQSQIRSLSSQALKKNETLQIKTQQITKLLQQKQTISKQYLQKKFFNQQLNQQIINLQKKIIQQSKYLQYIKKIKEIQLEKDLKIKQLTAKISNLQIQIQKYKQNILNLSILCKQQQLQIQNELFQQNKQKQQEIEYQNTQIQDLLMKNKLFEEKNQLIRYDNEKMIKQIQQLNMVIKNLKNSLAKVQEEGIQKKKNIQEQLEQKIQKNLQKLQNFSSLKLKKQYLRTSLNINKLNEPLINKNNKIVERKYPRKYKFTYDVNPQNSFISNCSQDSYNEYIDTEGNQTKVQKQDLRKIISNPSICPFNLIGKIVSTIYDKQQKIYKKLIGTGILIHSRIVLTVAHNIYFSQQNINSIANKIYFFRSTQQQFLEQNGIKVINYSINSEYFNKISKKPQKYDICFLQLQKNQKNQNMQPLKLNLNYKYHNYKEQTINITGYSGDYKDSPNTLYCQQNKALQQKQDFLYYSHTTHPGNSGCPILLKSKQGNYQIIGVHKGTKIRNYGILLSSFNKQQFLYLSQLIQKYSLEKYFQQLYTPSYRKLQEDLQWYRTLINIKVGCLIISCQVQ